MQKAVMAINMIGTVPVAVFLILVGLAATVFFGKYNIDARNARDVIVAGITLLTTQASKSFMQSYGDKEPTAKQTVESPSVPETK